MAQLRPRPAAPRPDQLPPHDVAAEEAVIAALLLDGDIAEVSAIVSPIDFYREHNGWVFEACLALSERSERITIPTVAHELDRAGRLDGVGGEPYLVEIAGKYFTAVGVEAHARIVARDALYRRLIGASGQIAQLAYLGGPDTDRVLSQAEHMLGAIRDSAPVVTSNGTTESAPRAPYAYSPLLDEQHFVTRFQAANRGLGVPMEYLEAGAYVLLASCLPTLHVSGIAQMPDLPMNIYFLLLGPTSFAGKTVAIQAAKRLLREVDPQAVLPELMTPESAREQLGMRAGRSAIWMRDEFSQYIRAVRGKPYMADFEQILLEAYDGHTFTVTRRSKLTKGGERVEDIDHIADPRLSILAGTTPEIAEHLTRSDLESGLLPRFALMWPSVLPETIDYVRTTDAQRSTSRELRMYLAELRAWALNGPRPEVYVSDEALDELSVLNRGIRDSRETAAARIPPMAMKCAALIALGSEIPLPQVRQAMVEIEHMQRAIAIVKRWIEPARRLMLSLPDEQPTRQDRQVRRVEEMLRTTGSVTRQAITQTVTHSAIETDRLAATLVESGVIRVVGGGPGGRRREIWRIAAE